MQTRPYLVDWFGLGLTLSGFGGLSPHLFHIFQNHVAMPVKSLDTGKKFAVVSTIDQHL